MYGHTADGAAVQVFTLTNGRGVTVKVLDLGGIITEFDVPDRQGKMASVVLGLPDLAAYEATGGLNCIIGRYPIASKAASRTTAGTTI